MKKKQTNSIWSLLIKSVGEFTEDELNVLFSNMYNFSIYTENTDYFIMYDLDNCVKLDKDDQLFYCIAKAKKVYKHNLELSNKRKITNEFKKLFDL